MTNEVHNDIESHVESDLDGRLPHHSLNAWNACLELARAVRAASISDPQLREQALRAAKSACLNCSEGSGKSLQGDRKRAFSTARGEAAEAAGAVEIAVALGSANLGADKVVNRIASLAVKLLGGLCR
jgi:four helix bundle protein